jgi:hypothetical protein
MPNLTSPPRSYFLMIQWLTPVPWSTLMRVLEGGWSCLLYGWSLGKDVELKKLRRGRFICRALSQNMQSFYWISHIHGRLSGTRASCLVVSSQSYPMKQVSGKFGWKFGNQIVACIVTSSHRVDSQLMAMHMLAKPWSIWLKTNVTRGRKTWGEK